MSFITIIALKFSVNEIMNDVVEEYFKYPVVYVCHVFNVLKTQGSLIDKTVTI